MAVKRELIFGGSGQIPAPCDDPTGRRRNSITAPPSYEVLMIPKGCGEISSVLVSPRNVYLSEFEDLGWDAATELYKCSSFQNCSGMVQNQHLPLLANPSAQRRKFDEGNADNLASVDSRFILKVQRNRSIKTGAHVDLISCFWKTKQKIASSSQILCADHCFKHLKQTLTHTTYNTHSHTPWLSSMLKTRA